ncbi:glycerol-1-phosphate dehydrogenase [Paenibacillus darwinianus]|uniref:Glycerol-1-phosphate dehydrogenase n=1 Tax=Paenibacillus darwinianus TaxID=1380763 RepID=A0A9W5S3N6_9BACL|nr:sn-glycerol-1-phosphate dehydrogenase [Paenibacillus darwinianus]EXX90743.1 glycerol-1-phosphate dehydrogenase [Paenibacillus darwinianus]EXX91481.1 glycerol-1-phosphate dehydrogenase [Paenibacillus darwinianus]EXX92128.1 glycerol-1-phosphate dehydrogenase [Paenibacillus darwinianus]
MADVMQSIRNTAKRMNEPLDESLFPERMLVQAGAIGQVAPYLQDRGNKRIVVVSDSETRKAAGATLLSDAKAAGLSAEETIVKPNAQGDVVADEASIVQVIIDIQRTNSDIAVAAGSGTIHDIVRYAAYTTGIPFVSVPTAPSVDGFTSKGAPILVRGEKITLPAIGPAALFADVAILRAAPRPLIAAGFGDMLGKYTSLFDWTFGHLTAGEPYSPLAAELTQQALTACVENADAIGSNTEEGVTILIHALIQSGIAMLIFGQSHPASGAEHHLSHYWEMAFVREGRRQLLHGAKVGVACTLIAALYHRVGAEGMPAANGFAERHRSIESQWSNIQAAINRIPLESRLRELIRAVGGPSSLAELGVERELAEHSLQEAHRVRLNRYTLLRAMNEG